MISKMINEMNLSKQDRKKFIPFVNERDHMGLIIKNKPRQKQFLKSIDIFQNLKKTTKQYFFDKKFDKMKQKLERYKQTLKEKQPDYDQEVKNCFKSLEKVKQLKKIDKNNKENHFYIDLNDRFDKNIKVLKEEIEYNKKDKMQKTITSYMKYKTVHGSLSKTSQIVKSETSSFFNPAYKFNPDGDVLRQSEDLEGSRSEKKQVNEINRELFKTISLESQKMVDFTNFGLKYRKYVHTKNQNPWKKWYVQSTLQIFPGQKVKIKKLQKSIY